MKESNILSDNVVIKQLQLLTRHKRAVHEGVKYPFRNCGHQSASKVSHAQHERAVDEGVKYPCGQCGHQSTSKGGLAQHKRALYEGIKYPCDNVDSDYVR